MSSGHNARYRVWEAFTFYLTLPCEILMLENKQQFDTDINVINLK